VERFIKGNVMKTKPFDIKELKDEILKHFILNYAPSRETVFTGKFKINNIEVEYNVHIELPSDLNTDFEVFLVSILTMGWDSQLNSLCEPLSKWINNPVLTTFEIERPETMELNINQYN
jgi:hypothetical protein